MSALIEWLTESELSFNKDVIKIIKILSDKSKKR